MRVRIDNNRMMSSSLSRRIKMTANDDLSSVVLSSPYRSFQRRYYLGLLSRQLCLATLSEDLSALMLGKLNTKLKSKGNDQSQHKIKELRLYFQPIHFLFLSTQTPQTLKIKIQATQPLEPWELNEESRPKTSCYLAVRHSNKGGDNSQATGHWRFLNTKTEERHILCIYTPQPHRYAAQK